jgi:hypothetical protein
MLNTSCTKIYVEILKNNKCNENIILLHDTTHYRDSIIHYDTPYYDQPQMHHSMLWNHHEHLIMVLEKE